MPNYRDIEFDIARQTDKRVLAACRKLHREGVFPWKSGSLSTLAGVKVTVTPEGSPQSGLLERILDKQAEIVSMYTFSIKENYSVTITRAKDSLFDRVKIFLGQGKVVLDIPETQIVDLEAGLRKHLKALGARQSITAILGKEMRTYYEAREAELEQLEGIVSSAQEKLLDAAVGTQQKLEDEFAKRKARLDEELEFRGTQVAAKLAAREDQLSEREASLAERVRELDDRDNRHARRSIRKDLKKEFEKRSSEFRLTQGTQLLRRSVWWFTVSLIVIFGTGFGISSWQSFQAIASQIGSSGNSPGFLLWVLIIRQALFGVAFGGASIFFIRWNNGWFEQHATEEFKLKRMEIDFDRASWLVEMAMEWKEEQGAEIPTQLLDSLSENLFKDGNITSKAPDAADQLASALLGSSSRLKLQLPGGIGTLEVDRKGMKELDKAKASD